MPPVPAPSSGADAALAALRREMAAAKEGAAAEIALMRRQLASAQAAASEAEKAGALPMHMLGSTLPRAIVWALSFLPQRRM